jgi:hypothetical protein
MGPSIQLVVRSTNIQQAYWFSGGKNLGTVDRKIEYSPNIQVVKLSKGQKTGADLQLAGFS